VGFEIHQKLAKENLDRLISILSSSDDVALQWIGSRVELHKEHWIKGPIATEKKNILVFPGFLAGTGEGWPRNGFNNGGALGEMVQWSDVLASLVALGHNVTFDVHCDQEARFRYGYGYIEYSIYHIT